jgi:heme exporter protein CcmD
MNFDMGTYGGYIWPAYGVSALGIGIAVVWTVAAWRKAKAKLAALEKAPRGAPDTPRGIAAPNK